MRGMSQDVFPGLTQRIELTSSYSRPLLLNNVLKYVTIKEEIQEKTIQHTG